MGPRCWLSEPGLDGAETGRPGPREHLEAAGRSRWGGELEEEGGGEVVWQGLEGRMAYLPKRPVSRILVEQRREAGEGGRGGKTHKRPERQVCRKAGGDRFAGWADGLRRGYDCLLTNASTASLATMAPLLSSSVAHTQPGRRVSIGQPHVLKLSNGGG